MHIQHGNNFLKLQGCLSTPVGFRPYFAFPFSQSYLYKRHDMEMHRNEWRKYLKCISVNLMYASLKRQYL